MDVAGKLEMLTTLGRKAGLGLMGAALTVTVATGAQAGEGVDALVFQNDGKAVVGAIDAGCYLGLTAPPCDASGTFQKVFEAELEENGTSPGLFGSADAPGFLSVADADTNLLPAGDNLDPGAGHSIDIILAPNSPVPGASILYWDGNGAVSWSGVPNNEFMELIGNAGSGGAMGDTDTLPGVLLDSPDGSGFTDSHPDYFLRGETVLDDPALGFYAIFGITNVDGLDPSNVWSIVFDFGIEDEVKHEAAIDSVTSFIPEPSTALLLGMGLAGLGVRGRRS